VPTRAVPTARMLRAPALMDARGGGGRSGPRPVCGSLPPCRRAGRRGSRPRYEGADRAMKGQSGDSGDSAVWSMIQRHGSLETLLSC
jgi:hypothetical protein